MLPCRGEELRQREDMLRAQLQELTSIQQRAVQALQASTGAGNTSQPSSSAAPSAASAQAPAQPQPQASTGPSGTNNAAAAGPGTRSPPQSALFGTPAGGPSSAAQGLAQVLEGRSRTGRITSAMFGSAIQAAMAAATQVGGSPIANSIVHLWVADYLVGLKECIARACCQTQHGGICTFSNHLQGVNVCSLLPFTLPCSAHCRSTCNTSIAPLPPPTPPSPKCGMRYSVHVLCLWRVIPLRLLNRRQLL